MENERQPGERTGRVPEGLCFCPCLLPRSTSREEIPLQDMGPPAEEAAPQGADEQPEVVPVAALNPEGVIGPQQPINQAAAGIPFDRNERGEAGMETRERQSTILLLQEIPTEISTFFVVFLFMLLFYLFLGQALNVISHELGWRGNGTENAPIAETNVIFNITTPIFNATRSIVDLRSDTNI